MAEVEKDRKENMKEETGDIWEKHKAGHWIVITMNMYLDDHFVVINKTP